MFLFMFTTGLTVYRTSVSVALKIIQRWVFSSPLSGIIAGPRIQLIRKRF